MGGKYRRRLTGGVAVLALTTCLAVAGACGTDTTAGKDQSPGKETSRASAATATSGAGGSRRVPQPAVPDDIPVAPESERVDLSMPTFSDTTDVTNPLFPVSRQRSVLFVGHVDGKPFRTEVTLLPETRIVEWQGQQIETLVSQYTAYLDGRIQEVAYDLYAQADDRSVWYFGEDVADFEDGAIVTKEGTWIAGKDGPAAMIMPADPKVGDVFRTENIPGIAFEEVTVKSASQRLDGPTGPVEGGLIAQELHMDGKSEDKTFAPGYGEFLTSGAGDVEALALAVPTDALSGPVPADVETLSSGALDIFDAARSRDWNAASTTLEKMSAAWETYKSTGKAPKLVEPRMSGAVRALIEAVDSRNTAHTRQAAIDAARWSLDLQLQYRPPEEIDLSRFDLWAAQLQVDAAAKDAGAVHGDFFTLDYIRDRILQSLDKADLTHLNIQLAKLESAVDDGDLTSAASVAEQLRNTIGRVRQ